VIKPLNILLLFAVLVFLYGCPYESPYPIDNGPQQDIDETLLGKWAAVAPRPSDDKHYREEAVKIIFEKKTAMEYDISITGYIDELKPYRVVANDSIKGTAFLSAIGSRLFLNSFICGKYYLAEVIKEKNSLSILCLSEHFTNKYIKSSEVLRAAMEVHYRTRVNPGYDDWFVLKNLQKVN
jgi:hypothetical protein